jgi:EAL domain-containing protein (putative c-di-GMP-specific phosphodiesterase class I)
LASGEVVGVEALARWQHPTDGLVLPYRFIPVAEEYGLIDALGGHVLRNAVLDMSAWRHAGYPLHVAVNVSMASLAAIDFPDRVVALAHAAGVPACDVVLEVTESRLMDQPTSQLDVLTRLRLKRVCLSIDDFGTGYSCMSQLRDLPFDELKIDRGFVHGVAKDSSLRAIVDSILGLVRQLGVRSVAEGIEDREDWDVLRAAGCDMGQGYFIGRPMPVKQLLPWLNAWPERWAELAA